MPRARVPLSTYRLQFNTSFTFGDASSVVPYLHDLGVTDCYASSYLAAIPGSDHGYNVVDPTRLNPELGPEQDYWSWIDAMHERGMGHVIDVVPNHMGIVKSANPWWLDVLENGPSSRFARFFDIEWYPVKDELANKVLIPILGDQYGAVLERQELRLAYDKGAFLIRYFDQTLPIAPDTYGSIFADEIEWWAASAAAEAVDELRSILTAAGNLPPRSERDPAAIAVRAREKEVVKRRLAALVDTFDSVGGLIGSSLRAINGVAGQPRSFDRLDRLLNLQSYRLAHWRVASEEINYRRFFDVNELAALRMEDPAVFEEVHRFVFDLVRRGAATGLRIDHVDGLYAPEDYLRRLQATLSGVYVVVEKILTGDEQLSTDWPVHGTTGYEFAAVVNNLFVDSRNERAFDAIYSRFIRQGRTFEEIVYHSKKRVLHETMSGDINSLGHQLNRFSERNRHFRDFTLYSLISTLKDVIACFPVYRTYVTPQGAIGDHDRRYISAAIRCAKRRAAGTSMLVFDFVERLLLKQTPTASVEECEERARFIGKFQQITSPVAAKGIEDTALYTYNRLLSLNEVGSDPTQFGLEPGAAHSWMIRRQERWPHALSSTSTHDTKRGEDVRARLNVLSEIPGAWKAALARWRTLNRRLKTEIHGAPAPDANEEYLLYQTLLGTWPFERAGEVDEGARTALRSRIARFIVKALREAKVHTSWVHPDEAYEEAVSRFAEALFDPRRSAPFLASFTELQRRIAHVGVYNSLAQLVIKATAPGVPDFYQGTELWDFNLVDPDNRRPVDYGVRRDALAALKGCATPEVAQGFSPADLLAAPKDGRVKLFTMRTALEARASHRAVFEDGSYRPLPVSGALRDHLFAFARVDGGSAAIVCVPRLVAAIVPDGGAPLGRAAWGDTRIELPDDLVAGIRSVAMRDVFTDTRITVEPALSAAVLFDRFPVALLVQA